MSENQIVRFGPETWRKGHRGKLLPHATDKPFLENLQQWTNGHLGPRPWWQDTPVQLSALITQNARIIGANYSYGQTGGQGEPGILAVGSSEVEFYRESDNYATVYANNATGVPNVHKNSWVTQIDTFNWLVHDSLVLSAGPAPAVPKTITVTSLATAVDSRFGGGAAIQTVGSTVHQGRSFIWGGMLSGSTVSAENRIYYSDAYAYTTFTSATQFFDVDGSVQGCMSLGSNLVIWTQEGRWYVLQGRGDPSLGTLNFVGFQRIPPPDMQPAHQDGSGVFLSADGNAICQVNGSGAVDDTSLLYLGPNANPGGYIDLRDIPSPESSSLYNFTMVPTSNTEMLVQYEGVWYREKNVVAVFDDHQRGIQPQTGRLLLMEWNTATSRWDVFFRTPVLTGLDEDSLGNAFVAGFYETSAAQLYLPRLSDPTKQIRVKRIVIDGQTWSGNGLFSPGAAVSVVVYDGKEGDATMVLGPESTPLASQPSRVAPVRIVATPPDMMPYTSFSDIKLENMKGIAIQTITVEVEISQGPIQ